MLTDKEIDAKINAAPGGAELARWAPGAGQLGWTIYVANGAVIVNSALNTNYRRKLRAHLEQLLTSEEASVVGAYASKHPNDAPWHSSWGAPPVHTVTLKDE